MREDTRPHGRIVPRAPRPNATAGFARVRSAIQRRAWVTTILAIALGAAVGANPRYGLSIWAAQQWGTTFPYGTLLINVLGSCAIGRLLGLVGRAGVLAAVSHQHDRGEAESR